MNQLAQRLLEVSDPTKKDPLVHTKKEWTREIPPKRIINAHRYGVDREDFASMNQVVRGNPPLYTGGVNGCSVVAGQLENGTHFLAHLDSLEFTYGVWRGLLQGGRGRSPAKSVFVLTLPHYVDVIPKGIVEWNNIQDVPWGTQKEPVRRGDGPSAINPDHLSIHSYDMPDDPREGLFVTYDGKGLTYTVEPKPWD